MNYPESKLILEKVKKAKRILVNCHRGPDPDSFGSALGFYFGLKKLEKEVHVVCTKNSELPKSSAFLPGFDQIERVDFAKLNFSDYDLFIIPDSSSWQQVVDDETVKVPSISIAVVDHHLTNEKFGNINLVDINKTSCAEMVYLVLQDWNVEINKEIATCLLAGIIVDTGNFQFTNDSKVLIHAAELMELGGDKSQITNNLFKSKSFNEVKLWGESLYNLKLDGKFKFIYSAVPYDIYKKYGKPPKIASQISTMFASIVNEADFGIIMVEKEKNVLGVSLRSKGSFDVSPIALELGGGGHRPAAACEIKGIPFDEAVVKVLEVVRKHAKGNR